MMESLTDEIYDAARIVIKEVMTTLFIVCM